MKKCWNGKSISAIFQLLPILIMANPRLRIAFWSWQTPLPSGICRRKFWTIWHLSGNAGLRLSSMRSNCTIKLKMAKRIFSIWLIRRGMSILVMRLVAVLLPVKGPCLWWMPRKVLKLRRLLMCTWRLMTTLKSFRWSIRLTCLVPSLMLLKKRLKRWSA